MDDEMWGSGDEHDSGRTGAEYNNVLVHPRLEAANRPTVDHPLAVTGKHPNMSVARDSCPQPA